MSLVSANMQCQLAHLGLVVEQCIQSRRIDQRHTICSEMRTASDRLSVALIRLCAAASLQTKITKLHHKAFTQRA